MVKKEAACSSETVVPSTKLHDARPYKCTNVSVVVVVVVVVVVPLEAWSDPEGSRKLRFPDFMTTAQDGGKVISLRQRPPLPPGNTPDISLKNFNDTIENRTRDLSVCSVVP